MYFCAALGVATERKTMNYQNVRDWAICHYTPHRERIKVFGFRRLLFFISLNSLVAVDSIAHLVFESRKFCFERDNSVV